MTQSLLAIPANADIGLYAINVHGARVITFDPKGHLIVSQTSQGQVMALLDTDSDGYAETHKVLLSHLNKPHGLAFYNDGQGHDYLYVAQTDRVSRYLYHTDTVTLGTREDVLPLPAGGKHFTRTIAFGPTLRSAQLITNSDVGTGDDLRLYISVGSDCDACQESTFKRAAILESDSVGSYTAQFASGLRNSVFFTFHPITHQIWATEMGRDGLGAHLPPDEINIVQFTKNYGWPGCYGNRVQDTVYLPTPTPTDRAIRHDDPCALTEPAHIELPAHSAPLGLAFVPTDTSNNTWPSDWRGNLIVALHGSQDPKVGAGYKLVRYILDANGNVVSSQDLVTGWLTSKGDVLGRPVDVKILPNGIIYISDDYAGVIYQLKIR